MSTGTVSGVTLFPLGVCRYGSCTAGLKMFPGDGAHIDQMPQRPHPGPRDRGIGVFATFLKTCGILLVIILCLHSPEHFASVFPWNMLSSFQLNMQIFLKVMERFLYLKNAFPSHLLSLYTCAEAACPLPPPGSSSPLSWYHSSALPPTR